MTDKEIITKANKALKLSDAFKIYEYANENTPIDGIQAAFIAGYAKGYKQALKDSKAKRAEK